MGGFDFLSAAAPRIVTLRGDGLSALWSAFTVVRVRGDEAVNALFTYEVEVSASDSCWDALAIDLELPALQGKELTLGIKLDGGDSREITGIVSELVGPIPGHEHCRYRITLRPWLFLATLNSDYRIFQQKTVVQVLDALLADYPFAVDKRLDVARYPIREYQVQYGETDFAFFQRLTRAWGISFHFAHSNGHHRLVLSDGNGGFRRVAYPAYQTLAWRGSRSSADVEYLHTFEVRDRLVSGKWSSTDHDFGKPLADLHVANANPRETSHSSGEIRDYPGNHAQPVTESDPWEDGATMARVRMESIRQHGSRVSGAGQIRAVVPGTTFVLEGFARAAANREYLVIGARLELEETGDRSGDAQSWRCDTTFDAQSTDEIFRPDLPLSIPRTNGPETATVVGPDNQQIWTDEFGRVRVQFHWDRIGKRDADSSCWLRVAQAWQGEQFGTTHLPRIGEEVIVDFLSGNPDRPIITGRVANRLNMPAWRLPGQHALSGFRSKELFGERHNTFLQDDTQGQIQTQIGSDHQASTLSLGHIVRVSDHDGRRDKRGEGFELRTDGWGAVRGGSGLLLTSEPRPDARQHHKDVSEALQRLGDAHALHQSLGDSATHQQAQVREQLDVAQAIDDQRASLKGHGEQGEFAAPHLVMASPKGIAATAADALHLHNGRHAAWTSGGHLSMVSGKSWLASAVDNIVLFARQAGLRLFAAKGKIDIQAQSDDIEIIAQKVLRLISAQERIEITAREVVINGGGSYVRIDAGGIEQGTTGIAKVHAADCAWEGPKSIAPSPPEFPNDICIDCMKRAASQGAALSRANASP